jgi:prepilin signal peptidase PulO-like enzyme (type II secretory pathway)
MMLFLNADQTLYGVVEGLDALRASGGDISPNIVLIADAMKAASAFLSNTPCLIALGIIGLMIGSLMSQVAPRLAVRLIEEARGSQLEPPPLLGPSECMSCSRCLSWSEIIPLLSWILQSGRCMGCGTPIGKTYLLTEVAAAIAVLLPFLLHPGEAWTIPLAMAGLSLVACAATDAISGLIPDIISIPMLWSALMAAALNLSPVSPMLAILGVALAWSVMRAIDALPGGGIGGGDIKMAVAIGAMLGPTLSLSCIVSAFALSWIAGKMGAARDDGFIRFGPFLAAASLLAFVFIDGR